MTGIYDIDLRRYIARLTEVYKGICPWPMYYASSSKVFLLCININSNAEDVAFCKRE